MALNIFWEISYIPGFRSFHFSEKLMYLFSKISMILVTVFTQTINGELVTHRHNLKRKLELNVKIVFSHLCPRHSRTVIFAICPKINGEKLIYFKWVYFLTTTGNFQVLSRRTFSRRWYAPLKLINIRRGTGVIQCLSFFSPTLQDLNDNYLM